MTTEAPESPVRSWRDWTLERMTVRNAVSREFFAREAEPLALACREMSERFQRGGRLIAFGRDHSATDAQHVSVEFVHPVIVGKRALPALDLSLGFRRWLPAVLRPEDIVMGFAPPEGDLEVAAALAEADGAGAQTFALPGPAGSYAVEAPSDDPLMSQEIIEVLYHTLWETVHVFFEHHEMGHEVGQSGFLYPFLGRDKQDTSGVIEQVAASIRGKAEEDERLRLEVAEHQGEQLGEAALALSRRFSDGGTMLVFGNGGSATDANDWAMDTAVPQAGRRPHPAVSLSMEPANLSAIANDIGAEAIFLRQLIAQRKPQDVAVGISTSGGSANILEALEEARKGGLLTLALLGYDGGEVVRRDLVDHALVVQCDYVPRIQEIQASVYHLLLEAIEMVDSGA